jgi:antitoxin component of MazEF toxin-antitoxin module
MAVLIPSPFAKMREINVGSVVNLEAIKLVKPRRQRYKLSELMAKFKPEHRHGKWNIGGPVGRKFGKERCMSRRRSSLSLIPNPIHAILAKNRIDCHDRNILGHRLGHDQSVEGIPMI